MNDPYKTLGISPNATDDELKKAYRDLARKYHPDRYTNDPELAKAAEDKMKEINAAYEEIQNIRSGKSNYDQGTSGTYRANSTGSSGSRDHRYVQVRSYINSGMLNEADEILLGVHEGDRNGEWHYLKGFIELKRGHYSEAKTHFDTACKIDPYNYEYRRARAYMNNRAEDYGRGYTVSESDGCSPCHICGFLILLDCCCRR